MIAAVVTRIRRDSPAGGFVKLNPGTQKWFEIGDEKARDKVGHAIRRCIDQKARPRKIKRKSKEVRRRSSMGSLSGMARSSIKLSTHDGALGIEGAVSKLPSSGTTNPGNSSGGPNSDFMVIPSFLYQQHRPSNLLGEQPQQQQVPKRASSVVQQSTAPGGHEKKESEQVEFDWNEYQRRNLLLLSNSLHAGEETGTSTRRNGDLNEKIGGMVPVSTAVRPNLGSLDGSTTRVASESMQGLPDNTFQLQGNHSALTTLESLELQQRQLDLQIQQQQVELQIQQQLRQNAMAMSRLSGGGAPSEFMSSRFANQRGPQQGDSLFPNPATSMFWNSNHLDPNNISSISQHQHHGLPVSPQEEQLRAQLQSYWDATSGSSMLVGAGSAGGGFYHAGTSLGNFNSSVMVGGNELRLSQTNGYPGQGGDAFQNDSSVPFDPFARN